MALARNRIRINVKGGGKLQLRQISPSANNTFLDAGYLGGTKIADTQKMVTSTDEAGNTIDSKSGEQVVTITTSLKQSGADEINLLKNADGIYYDLYYAVTTANGTLVQEWSFPLCKIKVGPVLDFKSATERTIALEITALAPVGAFTRTPTNFNVVANTPYYLYESGTAVGAPTDTAATLATAIL